jgi:DNA end-binding protein Ku
MALRSMANTNVVFGLISVPVKVYSAIESRGMAFHQYHQHDDGTAHRVTMPTVCTGCGEVASRGSLIKGAERGDTTILITADELAAVEPESAKDFEVLKFVDAAEIDPISYSSPYYLEPDAKRGKRAVETYSLLRTVLTESGRVGIVTYTMRSKTHLAVLRPSGNALVLQNIAWPADVRSTDELTGLGEVKVNPAELKLARQLVDAMTGPFVAGEHVDTYATAVENLIDSKANGGEPMTACEETEAAAEVSDLLAALEASVAAKTAAAPRRKPRARKAVAA